MTPSSQGMEPPANPGRFNLVIALKMVTKDASDFFARFGFSAVERTDVPREIQATREYREQCSDSAAVMCLPLSTRL